MRIYLLTSIFYLSTVLGSSATPKADAIWGIAKQLTPLESADFIVKRMREDWNSAEVVIKHYLTRDLRTKVYKQIFSNSSPDIWLKSIKAFSDDEGFLKLAGAYLFLSKNFSDDENERLYDAIRNTNAINLPIVLAWIELKKELGVADWERIPNFFQGSDELVRGFFAKAANSDAKGTLRFIVNLAEDLQVSAIKGWAAGASENCAQLRSMVAGITVISLNDVISIDLLARDPEGCNSWWQSMEVQDKIATSEWMLRNISNPAVWKQVPFYRGVSASVDIKLAILRAGMFPEDSIKTLKSLSHSESFHGVNWSDFSDYISPRDYQLWLKFVDDLDESLREYVLMGVLPAVAHHDLKTALTIISTVTDSNRQLGLLLGVDDKVKISENDLALFKPDVRDFLERELNSYRKEKSKFR